MSELVKCSIYARYSTNNQREASIEDQIRKCRETATAKGWEILEDNIYFDKAQSGTKIASRDGFKEMMRVAMSDDRPFQRILVDDTSRIARNTKEALDIFSLLSFYGVHVYYVSQGIDTAHETAEEMITINGLIDSLYIRNLAKETHRGIEGQVLKGYSGGGRRYGYHSEPVTNGKVDIYGNPEADGYILRINPDEANVILRIFTLYAEKGYSAKKIVTILNSELKETGDPQSPRGSFWSVSTILGSKKAFRGILNNEIYIGRYHWNRSSSKRNPETGKNKKITKDRDKWISISVPDLKIIPDELWEKAKQKQKSAETICQGAFMKARSAYSVNLVTGLAKCGVCGGNIVVVSGGRFGKYGCSNNWNKGESVCLNNSKIKKTDLHRLLIDSINIRLDESTSISYLREKVKNLLKEKLVNRKQAWKGDLLEDQIKKIRKEIDNFINALRIGIISDEVKLQLAKAERKKNELEQLLRVSQQERRDVPVICDDLIRKYAEDLHNTLNLHPVMGRNILANIFDNIVVKPVDNGSKVFFSYKAQPQLNEVIVKSVSMSIMDMKAA